MAARLLRRLRAPRLSRAPCAPDHAAAAAAAFCLPCVLPAGSSATPPARCRARAAQAAPSQSLSWTSPAAPSQPPVWPQPPSTGPRPARCAAMASCPHAAPAVLALLHAAAPPRPAPLPCTLLLPRRSAPLRPTRLHTGLRALHRRAGQVVEAVQRRRSHPVLGRPALGCAALPRKARASWAWEGGKHPRRHPRPARACSCRRRGGRHLSAGLPSRPSSPASPPPSRATCRYWQASSFIRSSGPSKYTQLASLDFVCHQGCCSCMITCTRDAARQP